MSRDGLHFAPSARHHRDGTHAHSLLPGVPCMSPSLTTVCALRCLSARPKGGRNLTGSCISATGEWVACADAAGLKLYRLRSVPLTLFSQCYSSSSRSATHPLLAPLVHRKPTAALALFAFYGFR